MKTSVVSNVGFEGKIYYDKKLPKTMQVYAEEMLGTKIGNQTIREKLAEKTFDLTFFTTSSKKAIHPRLEFYSGFKVLDPKDKKYYNSRVRINEDFNKNVLRLSSFIDKIDEIKKNYGGYNTLGERIKIWANSILEKFIYDW